MRKATLFAACVLAAAAFAGAGCGDDDDDGGGGGGGGGGGEQIDVTLIVGVRGDEFYVTMECGAKEAAAQNNVKLDVQGPEEFDAAQQTPIVNSVVARRPDAIMIAPTDAKAMIAPIQQAVDAGIKVILVDTVLEESGIAESEIATDNLESGRVAAETLVELMGKPAPVMVVNVKPGISTTDLRQQGFEEGIKEHDGYEYLGAEFSNNEPAKAASIVTSTIQAEPNLGGIFATNLFSAEGSATGLRQSGNKKVKIVGFDAGPAQVEQLEQGLVQALIAQKPADIGKQGIEQAVAAVNGDPVKEKITTGTEVVTKENLDSPEGQAALYKAEC
jgi:ribose transport system substrate-binding protein